MTRLQLALSWRSHWRMTISVRGRSEDTWLLRLSLAPQPGLVPRVLFVPCLIDSCVTSLLASLRVAALISWLHTFVGLLQTITKGSRAKRTGSAIDTLTLTHPAAASGDFGDSITAKLTTIYAQQELHLLYSRVSASLIPANAVTPFKVLCNG